MILDLIVRNSGIYDRVVYKKTLVGIKKTLAHKNSSIFYPYRFRCSSICTHATSSISASTSSCGSNTNSLLKHCVRVFFIYVYLACMYTYAQTRATNIYTNIYARTHIHTSTRAYTLIPTHAHTYTHLYTTTHIHLRSAYRKHQFLYGTPYEFQDRLAFCSYIQREFISLRPNYTFLFYVQLQPLTLYVLVLYDYGHQISNIL